MSDSLSSSSQPECDPSAPSFGYNKKACDTFAWVWASLFGIASVFLMFQICRIFHYAFQCFMYNKRQHNSQQDSFGKLEIEKAEQQWKKRKARRKLILSLMFQSLLFLTTLLYFIRNLELAIYKQNVSIKLMDTLQYIAPSFQFSAYNIVLLLWISAYHAAKRRLVSHTIYIFVVLSIITNAIIYIFMAAFVLVRFVFDVNPTVLVMVYSFGIGVLTAALCLGYIVYGVRVYWVTRHTMVLSKMKKMTILLIITSISLFIFAILVLAFHIQMTISDSRGSYTYMIVRHSIYWVWFLLAAVVMSAVFTAGSLRAVYDPKPRSSKWSESDQKTLENAQESLIVK